MPSSKSLSTTALLCCLVLRGKQEREALSLVGQAIKLLQIFFGFRTRQFFQVALAKKLPLLRLGVKPFAQFIGGSKVP
jgi:hypothetical protein